MQFIRKIEKRIHASKCDELLVNASGSATQSRAPTYITMKR